MSMHTWAKLKLVLCYWLNYAACWPRFSFTFAWQYKEYHCYVKVDFKAVVLLSPAVKLYVFVKKKKKKSIFFANVNTRVLFGRPVVSLLIASMVISVWISDGLTIFGAAADVFPPVLNCTGQAPEFGYTSSDMVSRKREIQRSDRWAERQKSGTGVVVFV